MCLLRFFLLTLMVYECNFFLTISFQYPCILIMPWAYVHLIYDLFLWTLYHNINSALFVLLVGQHQNFTLTLFLSFSGFLFLSVFYHIYISFIEFHHDFPGWYILCQFYCWILHYTESLNYSLNVCNRCGQSVIFFYFECFATMCTGHNMFLHIIK